MARVAAATIGVAFLAFAGTAGARTVDDGRWTMDDGTFPTIVSRLSSSVHDSARGLRDRVELEGFLDGLMAAGLKEKHVAGATVSVVKDGALFFAKGYGFADVDARKPVDPEKSLFRVGSITKLFTWTAVMQLVEQGKLDLNKDINEYLDFKIPATFPEPITLTHVMTHTPGFEEDGRDLFTEDPKHVTTLAKWLPAHMPKRVRPPGTYSSYSNWATATAGYIVERVSGMPYDEYIDKNILAPLGMSQATTHQPLPERLAPDMSKGYHFADGGFVAKPFELITGGWPAGSVSASATDMAKFMIAHLNLGELNGQRILQQATAEKMHSQVFTHDKRLPGFAYGFYEQSSHGLRIFGHGGDTQYFHSDLALIPSERVGVFVSYNTDTGGALSFGPFLAAFLDHYYPEPAAHVVSKATKADLARYEGEYLFNRMSYSTFQKALGLASHLTIVAADSGRLVAKLGLADLQLVPVDSLLFRDVNGGDLVAFQADPSGKIVRGFISLAPMMTMEKFPGTKAPGFHLKVLIVGLVLFLLTIIAAIVRRFQSGGRPKSELPGRGLLVGLSVAFVFGVIAIVLSATDPDALMNGSGTGLKIALIPWMIGAVLTVLAVVGMLRQWGSGAGTFWSRFRYSLVTLAAVAFVWSLNTWNLLGWRM